MTPLTDKELRRKIGSILHRCRTRALRGAEVRLDHISELEQDFLALIRQDWEASRFNWTCQPKKCGAYNSYDSRKCSLCGSPRPKLYTESELQQKCNEARIDENSTIHRWLQRPENYDSMTTLEATQWVVMTLGKVGSWLDHRQEQLTQNQLEAPGTK